MSGIPYNELQDVNCTVNDTDGTTHVITTLHYAFVIPCRDCKHLHRDDPWWECHRAGFYVGTVDGSEPDGFCAWGERRDA